MVFNNSFRSMGLVNVCWSISSIAASSSIIRMCAIGYSFVFLYTPGSMYFRE